MTVDEGLRRDVKRYLDNSRSRVLTYTGLYSDEDLIRDVLEACREAAAECGPDLHVDEARDAVASQCAALVRVADRYGARDIAAITVARSRAVAAIDAFQDRVVRARRAGRPPSRSNWTLLRRPAL